RRPREAVLFASERGAITRADLDGPYANWFLDSVLAYGSGIPAGPGAGALEPVWEGHPHAVEGAGHAFVGPLTQALRHLYRAKGTDDLGRIAVAGAIDLVCRVVDGVVDLAEALLQAMYDLADKTLRDLGGLLGTPVTFAPLVALVNWLHDQAYPG